MLANHAIMGGPVAQRGCAASETPYAVKLHGSELEYAIRGNRRLADLARGPLDSAHDVFAGSQHIVDVTRELLGDGPYLDRVAIVPPGVDVDAFRPDGGSRPVLFELLRSDRPGAHPERHPDADAADRLERAGPFILYFGKLLRQKGVHLLLDAWRRLAPRHPDTSLVVVGFGSDRAWLESLAGERVIFTGAMDHAQLQQLVPCAELVVVPSVLPEAFGMVAAEAASCGLMTVVSDHSGLAEVAAGLGPASRTFDGSVDDLERAVGDVLDLPAADRDAIGLLGRERVCARWSWERIADRLISGVPQLDSADLTEVDDDDRCLEDHRAHWPVYAADGEQVGKVFLVVGDENEDIFDGLAITHHGGPFVFHNYEDRPHYVPADQVASIDPGRVTLSISAEQAAHLPLHDPPESATIEPESASRPARAESWFEHETRQDRTE